MTTTDVGPNESHREKVDADTAFAVLMTSEGVNRIVHVSGELDLATRNWVVDACTSGNPTFVILDVAGLSFMDCCGYNSIVESWNSVEGDGRTFAVRGHIGQPARLIGLIGNPQLFRTA